MDCMQCLCGGFLLVFVKFQYRKRYGLHAIANAVNIVREVLVSIPQAVWIACNSILSHGDKKFESFNTASGMDCMQSLDMLQAMNTGQFQYRKRYGLHAMSNLMLAIRDGAVSIPQAVWIACNFPAEMRLCMRLAFQYRKRYGLHAIFCF